MALLSSSCLFVSRLHQSKRRAAAIKVQRMERGRAWSLHFKIQTTNSAAFGTNGVSTVVSSSPAIAVTCLQALATHP